MSPDTPNNVTPIRHKTKDEKRIERRREELLTIHGVKEEQVDAVLAQEEFRRLPIDQKVNHLMNSIHNAQRIYNETIRELAGELVAIRDNQEAIADAFDINLKSLESILLGLGVTEAVQKASVEAATAKFMADKAAQQKAREDAKKDPEKAAVEKEISHSISEEAQGVVVTDVAIQS